jgi:hypothetical protein
VDIWNETVSFYLVLIEEFAMPGWNEASIDELLADPITRALMAADGVESAQLRALLYRVQQMIECYATKHGAPSSLAGFAQLYRARPKADSAQPTLSANCGRFADSSQLPMVPLASTLCETDAVRS